MIEIKFYVVKPHLYQLILSQRKHTKNDRKLGLKNFLYFC